MSVMVETNREHLRAAVFLRAVLPLIEVLARERPDIARLAHGLSASVAFDCAGSKLTAQLAFSNETVHVVGEAAENATLRFCFPDLGSMNAFFAGETNADANTSLSGINPSHFAWENHTIDDFAPRARTESRR